MNVNDLDRGDDECVSPWWPVLVGVSSYLAAVPSEAFGAGAAEGLQGVLADAAVEARLRVALVDFVLAVGAGEAGAAAAGVAVDLVRARPSVEAGAAECRSEEIVFRSQRGHRGQRVF